jgi:hypothetical protein
MHHHYTRPKVNYRKIYVDNFGPIPTDQNGRSYEIHHKDGNPWNNNPSNLVALTIDEHFDIHVSQGDLGAAMRIAQKMKYSPADISKFSSLLQKQRFQKGTHNFLSVTTEERRERQMRLVRKGSHHFCGDTNPVYKQLATGTHNFFGGEIQRRHNRRRVADGSHHLLGGAMQRKTLEDGTHSSCIKVSCPYCGKIGSKPALRSTHFDYCQQNPNRKERPLTECPHCHKIGTNHSLSMSHFDKCKSNPYRRVQSRKLIEKIKCSHCDTVSDPGNIAKHHGDKCKKRPPLQCT